MVLGLKNCSLISNISAADEQGVADGGQAADARRLQIRVSQPELKLSFQSQCEHSRVRFSRTSLPQIWQIEGELGRYCR